ENAEFKVVLSQLKNFRIKMKERKIFVATGMEWREEQIDIEEMIKTHPAGTKISFWCSEKDNGIYNAMNKGISHCIGKFIGIMNSGDFYCDNVFSKVALFAEKYPDSILYGAAAYYNKDEFLFVDCPSYKDLPKRMIPHEGSFVPSDIYKKYGTYDENYKISGDYEAFLRFYDDDLCFYFLGFIVYHFFTDGISNSSGHEKLLKAENNRIRKLHNCYIPLIKQCLDVLIAQIKVMLG
ncbi:MAG: hypothetical protein MJ159_04385, partial [Treponemataceae bacterium]|nr:hypothetical protein [Treponemataceae bacterium]